MVRRKPVGQGALSPVAISHPPNDPPYPTSPTVLRSPARPAPGPPGSDFATASQGQSPDPASSFELIVNHDAPRSSHNGGAAEEDEEEESDDEWGGDSDDEDEKEETHPQLPPTLRAGGGQAFAAHNTHPASSPLPQSLRAGPSAPLPEQSTVSLLSMTSTSYEPRPIALGQRRPSAPFQSNNPYLRMQHSGQNNAAPFESSASLWAPPTPVVGQREHIPVSAPAELPANRSPSDAFAQLSLLDSSQPPADAEQPSPNSRQAPLLSVEAENASQQTLQAASRSPSITQPHVPITPEHSGPPRPGKVSPRPNDWVADQLAADEAMAKELAHMEEQEHSQSSPQRLSNRPVPETPPDLPPRPSTEEQPPPMPPRPSTETAAPAAALRPVTEQQTAAAQRQRKEHYQIKHIRWYDDSVGQLRESPILIQNLNGPCPLLALVNALVLSTPMGLETGLIETLRTREQVSLGLLLDSVFDELMSGRRGGAAAELPDVGELYQFLLTLHTGMNVNPRFVPKATEVPNLMDADGPVADTRLAAREPGGFEETKEMRLYSTFDVPLIHGWLPAPGTEAFNAFDRSAKTFEDAQNIQFFEEELDERLRASGLNPDEIRQFENITTIKEFLNRWPTQLTDYGMDTIKQHMRPGSIAIFFRNDHFSTLYKEPRTGMLMGLVTDAGYSTHDEIVWESLVDVSGRDSEFFSGDFRPVGGASSSAAGGSQGPAGPRASSSRADTPQDGWTTVTGRRGNNRPDSFQPTHSPRDSGVMLSQQEAGTSSSSQPTTASRPGASQAEQEDHDLALALQLQEEEEDRARRETAARRERENQLSQQFLEGEGRVPPGVSQVRPMIPPRRSNTGAGQTTGTVGNTNSGPETSGRPAATGTGEGGEDVPPPSYEQAARRPAYHPPPGHPASAQAPLQDSPSSGPSAYQANNRGRRQSGLQARPSAAGRGRGGNASYGGAGQGYGQPVGEDRERCRVM